MNKDAVALLSFIKAAEKLKVELRHSYTSSIDRKESVAEHSWMLGLMAMLFFDFVDLKVDKLKVMKMVIIHDLAELLLATSQHLKFRTETQTSTPRSAQPCRN